MSTFRRITSTPCITIKIQHMEYIFHILRNQYENICQPSRNGQKTCTGSSRKTPNCQLTHGEMLNFTNNQGNANHSKVVSSQTHQIRKINSGNAQCRRGCRARGPPLLHWLGEYRLIESPLEYSFAGPHEHLKCAHVPTTGNFTLVSTWEKLTRLCTRMYRQECF